MYCTTLWFARSSNTMCRVPSAKWSEISELSKSSSWKRRPNLMVVLRDLNAEQTSG